MKLNNRGFTLIELMVVIAMIAILVGLGGPRLLEEIPKIKLKNAAYNLAGDLKMARSKAIKNQSSIRVLFTKSTDSYDLQSSGNDGIFGIGDDPDIKTVNLGSIRGGIKFGTGAAPRQANRNNSPIPADFDCVTFTSNNVTFTRNGLINGVGGYVYLSNQNDHTCYAVGMTSMAGIVVIRRNTGGAWVTL